MKKLLILIPLLGLACTKNYSCKCVTTYSDQVSEEVQFVKGSKKDAEKTCEAKSKTYTVIHNVKCELQ